MDETSAAQTVITTRRERSLAILAHFSVILVDMVPFANVLLAFLVWSGARKGSDFVRQHAVEAINFNIVGSVLYVALRYGLPDPAGIVAARVLVVLLVVGSLRMALYASQSRLARHIPHIALVK